MKTQVLEGEGEEDEKEREGQAPGESASFGWHRQGGLSTLPPLE